MNNELTYIIIRFYKSARKGFSIPRIGLSRTEALEHTNDPETSTKTYFDGFHDMASCEGRCSWCNKAKKLRNEVL